MRKQPFNKKGQISNRQKQFGGLSHRFFTVKNNEIQMGPQQTGMLFLGKENSPFPVWWPRVQEQCFSPGPTNTQHCLFPAQKANFLFCKPPFSSPESCSCPSPEGSEEKSKVGKCCHLHMANWRQLCQAWSGKCREKLLCCPVQGFNQALDWAQTSTAGRRHMLDNLNPIRKAKYYLNLQVWSTQRVWICDYCVKRGPSLNYHFLLLTHMHRLHSATSQLSIRRLCDTHNIF